MTCQRCKKSETIVITLSVNASAWLETRALCSNCIGWFQTYWERFMQIDLAMNALIQQPVNDLAMYLTGLGRIHVPGLKDTLSIVICCPECGERHIDEGEFKTKPHHTHACQNCGMVWRPAIINTVGVRFLPGFKNEG